MGQEQRCGKCGDVLPAGNAGERLSGLCPRCLAAGIARITETGGGAPAAGSPLKPGAVFLGFEILEALGRGGMGCVYRARQKSLDRLVALKVLAPELTSSDEFLRRFDREAKALAALNHPNVVRVYESGREGDLFFLVMEHVDGRTLDAVLHGKNRPALPELLTFFQGIARGLDHIHHADLVHRDIKPANILVSGDGTPKIADFGIAVTGEDGKRLTETGTFVGTPYYVSPEHVMGKRVDGRSDLYSLGVMLYEGIAGRPPFDGKSSTAVMMKHLNDAPPPLHALAPSTPPALQELVRRLLAKNPASRPDSGAAVDRELGRLGGSLSPAVEGRRPARPSAAPARRRISPAAMVASAVALVLTGVAANVLFKPEPPPKGSPSPSPVVRRPEPPQQAPTPAPAPEPEPVPEVPPKPAAPASAPAPLPPAPAGRLESVLAAGDRLLEDARKQYERAKSGDRLEEFTKAAFLAEEARLKFQAVQELAEGATLLRAKEQLQAQAQLLKLIHDSQKAVPAAAAVPAPRAPVVVDPAPLAPAPVPEKPRRLPVPDSARILQAEKDIKSFLKDEFAKRPPGFAVRLLQMGSDKAEEPASRWVLLREAQALAVQTGELATALRALEETTQAFDIDGGAAKLALLAKVSVKGPENSRLAAAEYVDLAKDGLKTGAYDSALSALQKAEPFARSASDAALTLAIQDLRRTITVVREEYQKIKPSLELRSPSNPEEVGRFLCFVKEDWSKGLPLLAASGSSLKALAEKDLASPREAARQVEVGDGWWDLGEKEKLTFKKDRLRMRAAFWYERALPTLTGLSRVLVEKRLTEVDGARPAAPGSKPQGFHTRTPMIGGTGAGTFEEVAPPDSRLVGLRYTLYRLGTTEILKSVQPVYSDGVNTSLGSIHGQPHGTVLESIAKPGYAVGGALMKSTVQRDRVDGLKLIFMRISGSSLDPRQTYESNWLLTADLGAGTKVAADGDVVVGLHGRCGADVDSLGLVQLKPGARAMDGEGFLQTWMQVGPIPLGALSDAEALKKSWIPNPASVKASSAETLQVDGVAYRWKGVVTPDFNLRLGNTENSATIASCAFFSDAEVTGAVLLSGSDDMAIWYLNGVEVHRYAGLRGVQKDEDRTTQPLTLLKGENVLVAVVINRGAETGLCARFVDRTGQPLKLRVAGEPEKRVAVTGTVDLLRMIDPQVDCPGVRWVLKDGTLFSPPEVAHPLVQIPYLPPEEYDFELVVERKEGVSSLDIGLVYGGFQYLMVIEGWGDKTSGLEAIDGKSGHANETSTRTPYLVSGRPSTILFVVRKTLLRVTVDGREVVRWTGAPSRCTLGSVAPMVRNSLFLQSMQSVYAVGSMKLTPVQGEGRPLR